MSRTTRRTSAAPLARLALVLTAALAAAGCSGGSELTGTLGNDGLTLAAGSGGGTGSVAPALVGRWFRLVYVPDSSGSVRTSETTLDLRADGRVIRTVVARQLSFGFADQVVSSGNWRATATTLTITITAVGTADGGGTSGVSPIDSSGGTFFTPPLTPNPPFTPNPPLGGTTPGTPTDSVATASGATTFSYRLETGSQGSTLFLNGTPFVRLLDAAP